MITPALTHYNYWRHWVEFHREDTVRRLRTSLDGCHRDPATGLFVGVEERTDQKWHERVDANVDRYLGLRVTGLTGAHHNPAEPILPWTDTADRYEPIITLVQRRQYGRYADLMTLYPTGEFQVHNIWNYRMLHRYTFIKWDWAIRDRSFFITEKSQHYSWDSVNARDFERSRPYLPLKWQPFMDGHRYSLVHNGNDWMVVSELKVAQDALNVAYAAAERRYARYEKWHHNETASPAVEQGVSPEALASFLQHTEVYPRPEEAN